jgi:AraC-like DNA-binding protein
MARSYKQKEPMVKGIVTPSILVALHQLANSDMNESFRKLYRKGKILEFFSLYMDQSKRAAEGKNECPYIANEMDIDRIHQARIILANNIGNPPSLPDLARQAGINEFKLKVGFKQVYGNTVYGYLYDLRMETARRMLEARNLQVKEIAFAMGYNNPSHFISAFKKKFGITPSKYIER